MNWKKFLKAKMRPTVTNKQLAGGIKEVKHFESILLGQGGVIYSSVESEEVKVLLCSLFRTQIGWPRNRIRGRGDIFKGGLFENCFKIYCGVKWFSIALQLAIFFFSELVKKCFFLTKK